MTNDLETGKKTGEGEQDPETFVAPDSSEQTSQPEQVEQTDQPEFELTPEIEEKIMDKVRDIDSKGIAFHWNSNHNLNAILNNGLFGFGSEDDFRNRSGKFPIYFNITGKMKEINTWRESFPDEPKNDIALSLHSSLSGYIKTTQSDTILMLDISSLSRTYGSEKRGIRNFNAYDESSTDSTDAMTGFRAYGRISPRKFTGLICAPTRQFTGDEESRYYNEKYEQYNEYLHDKKNYSFAQMKPIKNVIDEEMVENQAKILTSKQIEVNKDKPERLLPVYDIAGNLLWPQQMNYDEVKEYVAKRDKKRESEGEEKEEMDTDSLADASE